MSPDSLIPRELPVDLHRRAEQLGADREVEPLFVTWLIGYFLPIIRQHSAPVREFFIAEASGRAVRWAIYLGSDSRRFKLSTDPVKVLCRAYKSARRSIVRAWEIRNIMLNPPAPLEAKFFRLRLTDRDFETDMLQLLERYFSMAAKSIGVIREEFATRAVYRCVQRVVTVARTSRRSGNVDQASRVAKVCYRSIWRAFFEEWRRYWKSHPEEMAKLVRTAIDETGKA